MRKNSGSLATVQFWIVILCLLGGVGLGQGSALAASPSLDGYRVQAEAGGTIRGRVLYIGKPVRPEKIIYTANLSVCGNTREVYPIRVKHGGVADAVVSIANITHGKAFDFPRPVLDQKKCMFVPSVLLMGPGRLEVENSDPIAHDVQLFARFNPESNHEMPPGGPPIELPLPHPETVTIRCNIHKVECYVVIARNPYYALTRSGGAFTLADVPPGTYQLKVWQPELGAKVLSVTVEAGKTTTANFRLGR